MTDVDYLTKFSALIENYVDMARAEMEARWQGWELDLTQRELHEVIGGLLARQVTLATQFALVPPIWNGHIAPLILRTMADTYITLAWIFCEPLDRSRKYILYGLGQEKLHLEHRKSDLESQGLNPNDDPFVKANEQWLNTQRYTFLTEVNVGSWSGVDTRTMAQEAGCSTVYNLSYVPFSAATHSMWHHVSQHNLTVCSNPLHGYHRIPIDPETPFADITYLFSAALYVEDSFKLFDEKTDVKVTLPSAFGALEKAITELGQDDYESGDDGVSTEND
ncbi:MAG: hypothetical protein GY845_02195 [Planctomycetes bacterium]|nr:hypothetical protein [Planctomycetota bacterium]